MGIEKIRAVTAEMRNRKVNHGKSTSPTLIAWADRIDAEVDALAELIDTASAVRQFLRGKQWGTCHYMDGSDVYADLEDYAKSIDAALARVGGA